MRAFCAFAAQRICQRARVGNVVGSFVTLTWRQQRGSDSATLTALASSVLDSDQGGRVRRLTKAKITLSDPERLDRLQHKLEVLMSETRLLRQRLELLIGAH